MASVLTKLGVNVDELITILRLNFVDYELGEVKWAIEGLGLTGKVTESTVKSLLMLETNVGGGITAPSAVMEKINKYIQSAELIGPKNMKLSTRVMKVTKALLTGDYLAVEDLFKNDLQ